MSSAKTEFKTMDDYISSFPQDVSSKLQTLREAIKEEAPDAQETIKYGMPTFTLHGNLICFGAWKKHIGVYPVTASMEASIEGLTAYKTSGKGTIQFPLNQALPLPLIHHIVAFRVKEQHQRRS